MRKRSGRWRLEPRSQPCPCGSLAQHAVNGGSRERIVYNHATPDGATCPLWAAQELAEAQRQRLP